MFCSTLAFRINLNLLLHGRRIGLDPGKYGAFAFLFGSQSWRGYLLKFGSDSQERHVYLFDSGFVTAGVFGMVCSFSRLSQNGGLLRESRPHLERKRILKVVRRLPSTSICFRTCLFLFFCELLVSTGIHHYWKYVFFQGQANGGQGFQHLLRGLPGSFNLALALERSLHDSPIAKDKPPDKVVGASRGFVKSKTTPVACPVGPFLCFFGHVLTCIVSE